MAEGEDGTKGATDVAKKVVTESGGFFSHLFGGLFKTPMGLGKGVIGNTLLNPLGLLKTGGIFALLVKFAPDFIKALPLKIGGVNLGEKLVADMNKDGARGLVMDSGIAALLINGVTGGVGGVYNEVAGSADDKEPSGFAKFGSLLGSAAALGGIGYLAFKAVNSNGIGYAGTADAGTPKQPDTVPNAAIAPQKPPVATKTV